MKSSTVFSLIGLVGSTLSANGVTGYVAWNNLAGTSLRVELKRNLPTAQSQMASPAPIGNTRSVVQSVAPPQNLVYSVPTAPQGRTLPLPSTAQIFSSTSSSTSPEGWSLPSSARNQAENDVLYDLAQTLHTAEYRRLSDGERLDIARQIQAWLYSGADQWSLRSQFDAAYRHQIVGNYVFHREAYIKFAAERLAPEYWAALPAPAYPVGRRTESLEVMGYNPFGEMPLPPDRMMYPEPGYEIMPFEPPMGMPVPPPPEMLPYFSSQPYGQPAPQPYPYPDYGYPDYGYPDYGYPKYGYPDDGYPNYGYPEAQRPPTGNPYPSPQAPGSQVPGVTEISL